MCYIEFSKICGVAILFKSPAGFALGTITILISFQIFRKLEAGERNGFNGIKGQFSSRLGHLKSFFQVENNDETIKEIAVCRKLSINGE